MNSLGNRHVPNNIRILLVNNGKGTEFRLSGNPGAIFGDATDIYIAAGGHYGNKSRTLVKHYAEDLGFEYLTASTKEEYMVLLAKFVSADSYSQPIIFEIFTESADEDRSLTIISELEKDSMVTMKNSVKDFAKGVLSERAISNLKKLSGR